MSDRIELPHGGWAELKTPEQVTNGQRKLLRRFAVPAMSIRSALDGTLSDADREAIKADPAHIPDDVNERAAAALNADQLDSLGDVQSAAIVIYVRSWSIGDQAAAVYGDETAAMWAPRPGSTAGVLVSPNPTMETVDDLPGPVYDALAAATVQNGDGSVDTSVDGAGDPASPTVPSPA